MLGKFILKFPYINKIINPCPSTAFTHNKKIGAIKTPVHMDMNYTKSPFVTVRLGILSICTVEDIRNKSS
jgi:hypothetical protein